VPELPEVETTLNGIAPHILGQSFKKIVIREQQLRWPVPANLNGLLQRQTVNKLERRGKYLLFHTTNGCMLLHLGMSGSLRINTENITPDKHDHVDFIFASGKYLRFKDPRKFGCILWAGADPKQHPLLINLGPEPLSSAFNMDYLYTLSRGRKQAIKTFIMNSCIVVGIGNIYANEALFIAGIHPGRKAGNISRRRYEKLVSAIKQTLAEAIKMGGTTLNDFVNSNGQPGYFKQQLKVYDRAGYPCGTCNTKIKIIKLGQRATYYCLQCQT